MLKITLVKSLIGGEPRNVATAHALGLRRIGQSTVQQDNAVIRGMVHKIKHLLKVEEVEDQPITRKRQGKKATPVTEAAAPAPKKAAKAKAEAAPAEEAPAKPKRTTKKAEAKD